MAVSTEFTPDARRTIGYRAFRAFVVVVWSTLFRPTVSGREHVPSDGPYILAPVHRSNADFAFAVFVTPRKTFFMAKDNLWHSKALGRFISSMGAFPVHRGSADRASLKAAEAVLRAGEPLVLFPEGTRQEGPELGPMHEGAAFLAARTGAPIVPIGISGTDRALPKGAKLPRPVRAKVVIGTLVPAPSTVPGERVARSALAATTEALRVSLQAAYDEACGRLSAPAARS
jgi:1-acyl-sn-glycerol-3-phosphate acyltransferase